ncbi:MAG: DivIVA domain-containing protein [Deltaproteobacteria bacterium]|nr:DivIVA domain-containing protein [Deltaproteobacteria bacterium]MBW1952318.1 DivIVA domain-containing protein [Deltaproteobacteria bacterium]
MEAKLTPADIRQQRFRVSFRGFNIQEVESFLGQVAETLDLVRQENEAVRAELQRRQAELSEFKKREQLLKDTLINAQKVIESMKANAQKEAEIIIHDAELKAEKILQDSYTRQGRIKNEIEELKKFKATLNAQLRGIIDNHLRLLESEGETQSPESG